MFQQTNCSVSDQPSKEAQKIMINAQTVLLKTFFFEQQKSIRMLQIKVLLFWSIAESSAFFLSPCSIKAKAAATYFLISFPSPHLLCFWSSNLSPSPEEIRHATVCLLFGTPTKGQLLSNLCTARISTSPTSVWPWCTVNISHIFINHSTCIALTQLFQ